MKIALREFGTSLCTRASGRAAYTFINKALDDAGAGDVVTLDFSGVGSVTNSFADEVFGQLAAERGMGFLRNHTTFTNIDRNIALLIRGTMDRRIRQHKVSHQEHKGFALA